MARILYFAWVREKIGTPEERITLPGTVQTVAQLIAYLRDKGEPYHSLLADSQLRVAVNQRYATANDPLSDQDEVAIFPPVSGGSPTLTATSNPFPIPVIGFSAASGTGKTTLMAAVISELAQAGLRIAAIKHGHHPADPDMPGKDTYRFRQAGAATVLFAARERWFMIQELRDQPELSLDEQVHFLLNHDLILVEGYKNEQQPKIVVHRLASGSPSLHQELHNVVALVTDDPEIKTDLPCFALEDAAGVAQFIQRFFALKQKVQQQQSHGYQLQEAE
ncbi:molybdopterin-guanine dinucleotide biosynthesis protein B [Candidatus Magnetaquicoccus inordinatus]|uniref:molybdopterin-guanine dinucleotide biosynthesis protein B n=1 Tax=Candidatus Magnetaquicoccus inordinatus TaxID=2496818 RepID=UPI00187D162C|nr:molybdopterin-guanine dinucleotide biosynthesis protein B [Candidatus Magnetaquicoccus inordinatus]